MAQRGRRWIWGTTVGSGITLACGVGLAFVVNVLTGGTLPPPLQPLKGWIWWLLGAFFLVALVADIVSRRPSGARDDRELVPQTSNVGSNLRRPNPNFTGREELLERLRAGLEDDRGVVALVAQPDRASPQALYGMPGIGKTEIAREFAHRRHRDHVYDIVWWIEAEDAQAIPAKLGALCSKLGHPVHGAADMTSAALAVLERRERWLLIFDNVKREADISGFIPGSPSGHVIITSRNPAWSPGTNALRVDVFGPEEALEFLRKALPDRGDGELGALAEELGRLPLALDQAAGFIRQSGMTIEEYLRLLRANPLSTLNAGETADYPRSFLRTYAMAVEEIGSQSPEALDLLRVCAFLSPDGFPDRLLDHGVGIFPRGLSAAVTDGRLRLELVPLLARYSLIARQDGQISMHRLVQQVTREQLGADQGAWSWYVTETLDQACRADPDLARWRSLAARPVNETA